MTTKAKTSTEKIDRQAQREKNREREFHEEQAEIKKLWDETYIECEKSQECPLAFANVDTTEELRNKKCAGNCICREIEKTNRIKKLSYLSQWIEKQLKI